MSSQLCRRIMAQTGLIIKQDPILKITDIKRAGGVSQVVEHLLRKVTV
jgi:dihydroxyacid dehydratase/phosphogluconate dehydratase